MSKLVDLGTYVENTVSGVKGIVVMRSEYFSGYTWLWVQPRAADDKLSEEPKTVGGDASEWKYVGDGLERPAVPKVAAQHFELGARVRDVFSGFSGIVNSRTEHINHCFTYEVQSEIPNKETGGRGAYEAVNSQHLILVDDGYTARKVKRFSGAEHYTPVAGM